MPIFSVDDAYKLRAPRSIDTYNPEHKQDAITYLKLGQLNLTNERILTIDQGKSNMVFFIIYALIL